MFEEAFNEYGHYAITSLIFAVFFAYQSYKSASPILAIFSRWARWVFLSVSLGLFAYNLGYDKPFWVSVLTGFLVWFLIETIYNWILIGLMSFSEMPLTPHYKINNQKDDWPNEKRFILLREWIRLNGFERKESLKAQIEEMEVLRSSVFESEDKKVRLQVQFIPQRSGKLSVSYTFSSIAEDEFRVITDNFFLPYGGYYPFNWSVERRPWCRSIDRLFQLHSERMKKHDDNFVAWEDQPLEDIQRQHHVLERLNIEKGFQFSREKRDEFGVMTQEGKYRVWKELWLLNYLGMPSFKARN